MRQRKQHRSMSKTPNRSPAGPTTALALNRFPNYDRPSGQRQQPGFDNQPVYGWELSTVWLRLRADWSSIVVVPSEPDCSTASVAQALCRIGTQLSLRPIEFVEANEMDLESSARLVARFGAFDETVGPADARSSPSSWVLPSTRTVVALESPLANPLTLPILLAADAIVLCVRRGHDRIASVRDTIAAVGPDRILCCVLVDKAARR
jgi:hypothetical protein